MLPFLEHTCRSIPPSGSLTLAVEVRTSHDKCSFNIDCTRDSAAPALISFLSSQLFSKLSLRSSITIELLEISISSSTG